MAVTEIMIVDVIVAVTTIAAIAAVIPFGAAMATAVSGLFFYYCSAAAEITVTIAAATPFGAVTAADVTALSGLSSSYSAVAEIMAANA